jgi:hypothetical protein
LRAVPIFILWQAYSMVKNGSNLAAYKSNTKNIAFKPKQIYNLSAAKLLPLIYMRASYNYFLSRSARLLIFELR